MSWGVSPWVYPVWDSLGFLDLGDYFLPHFMEVFNYYLLKYLLMVFLFFFNVFCLSFHFMFPFNWFLTIHYIFWIYIHKAAREKQQITHKGISIRITTDLSIETLQARRKCQDILKVMKENSLQPRLLYPARISFKYDGEIKSFTDKWKVREFSTTKPTFQQMLKDLL